MQDPSLLCDKTELQKQARLKLHEEGFNYKKKSSRSKAFGPSRDAPVRQHISQELRHKRVSQLQEDLKEVDLQLSFALKQREKCANVNNYSKALDVSKEMDDLRSKKGKYQEELTLLQRKEAASKRVKKCNETKAAKASEEGAMLQFLRKSSSRVDQGEESASMCSIQVQSEDNSSLRGSDAKMDLRQEKSADVVSDQELEITTRAVSGLNHNNSNTHFQ